MQYSLQETDSKECDRFLHQSLDEVVRGMGMFLIKLTVFQGNASRNSRNVSVKAVVYRDGITGIEDCSRVHRAILPRLELAFPGQDISLEVSSPGIDRIIKDGKELAFYIGRGVRFYRTDISDWTEGILLAVDEQKIILRAKEGETELPYEIIGKAQLKSVL